MPCIIRCVFLDTFSHVSFATSSRCFLYSRSSGTSPSDCTSASKSGSSTSAILGHFLYRFCPGSAFSKMRNNSVRQITLVECPNPLVGSRSYCIVLMVLGGTCCPCKNGFTDKFPAMFVNHRRKRYGIA